MGIVWTLILGVVAVCGIAAALLTLLVRWNVTNREKPGTIAKTTLGAFAIITSAGLGISQALKLRPSPELAEGSGALSYIFAVSGAPARQAAKAPEPLPSVTLAPELDRVLRDYERAWRASDAAIALNSRARRPSSSS